MSFHTAFNPVLSIYDTLVDRDHWGTALEHVAQGIGCQGVTISEVCQSAAQPFTARYVSAGLRASVRQMNHYYTLHSAYERKWLEHLNDSLPLRLIEDDHVWSDSDITTERPDYAYQARQFGLFRRMSARLNKGDDTFEMVSLYFNKSQPSIPRESVVASLALLPHIAKAIEVVDGIDRRSSQQNSIAAVLDRVQIGIVVIDAERTVLSANCEAGRILNLNDGLNQDQRGRLALTNPEQTDQLGVAIGSVLENETQADTLLVVDRPSEKRAFMVDVMPMQQSRASEQKDSRSCIVTLVDPDSPHSTDISRMGVAYSLTEAELDVARHLIEGWSNADIAKARNVKTDTVKVQVNRLMAKTGTRRRGDLVCLIVKSCPPISTWRVAGTPEH